jgi:hypothetical protein
MLAVTISTSIYNKSGSQSASNSRIQVDDPMERKRQRERARQAAITKEQKVEINRKQRKTIIKEKRKLCC